ncbi:MAG: PAS domain S-box protein [Nitrospirota bacterium]|nr:PAS domain S-box protein [Nitrospirota bacterium]
MSPKKKPAAGFNSLRQQAEKALTTTRAQVKQMTPEEVQHLVHELQVHQIELEMQNEELRRTQVDLEVARDRYASLYDFTPVGYLTLDGDCRILEANLTFCHLVGLSRREILHKKLEKYMDPDDQGALYLYLDMLKKKAGTQTSDVLTLQHSTTPRRVRLEGCMEAMEPPGVASLLRIAVEDVTMWERLETAEEEQRALREVVMGGVMDAIVTTDEDQRIVLFNEGAEKMFGCPASRALGQSIDQFIPERFRLAHHGHHQQFQQNADRYRHMGGAREIFGLRTDGEEFPIEATISQVELKGKGKGKGKGKKLFTVVLRDITERREAQEAIKKEQEFIAAILDTTAGLLVVVDSQGNIVRFNRACEILTGFSSEEIQNKPFWETVLPSTAVEEVTAYFQAFIQGQASNVHENYWITKQKQLRWIAWSNTMLKDKDGAVKYLIASGIDLTEQRKGQEALEKERTFINKVLDTAGALVVILNPQWEILRINRACEQKVGHAFEDLKGEPFWNLSVISGEDDQGARRVLESYKARRLPATFESALVNKARQLSWIQWNTTAMYDEAGEVEYFIATGTDITARRQAEQDLQVTHQRLETQQNELRLLAAQLLTAQEEERRRISRDLHDDVNQRLALLSLKLQSAQKGFTDRHPVKLLLQELYGSVADLSDDIRHLAYQYHPSIIDDLGLGTALRSLCEDFAKWEGVSVTCEVPDSTRKFSQAQATCLYRVAQESLRNVSRHAQASAVHLVLKENTQEVTLSIRDNGVGFTVDKHLSHGLGFISMRERVHLLGGALGVASQPGQGTTVTVSIPENAQS